jgi:outer membrane lipoprotein-sorting protein
MLFLATTLLLLQDKAAEETLRRITESVVKATSVKVSFKADTVETDASGKKTTIVTVGLLAIGRPEKLWYRTQLLPEDLARGLYISLDERDYAVQLTKSDPILKMDARPLRLRVLQAFARGGGAGMLCWLGEPLMDPVKGRNAVGRGMGEKGDPQVDVPELQVLDLKKGSGNDLTYALKGPVDEVRVVLTYDPKTLKPLKRVSTVKTEQGSAVRTEVYDSFEINEGMNDDQFGALTGESPEYRVLRKIESAIQNSTTLQLKFNVEVKESMTNGVGLTPMKGSIVLKEGGKTKLTIESLDPKTKPVSMTAVSDGLSVGGDAVFRLERCANPPKVFHEAMKVCLSRPGFLIGTFVIGYGLAMSPGEKYDPDLGAAFRMDLLKEGEDDLGLKTLTYDLDRSVDSSVKLWYDPKDFHLVRRLLTSKQRGGGAYLETYSDWKVDAPIADDVFKVPSK